MDGRQALRLAEQGSASPSEWVMAGKAFTLTDSRSLDAPANTISPEQWLIRRFAQTAKRIAWREGTGDKTLGNYLGSGLIQIIFDRPWVVREASIMDTTGAQVERLARLSERQRQCLELVVQGLTSKQIARQLGLSPSTVDNHIQTAIDRLEVNSRAEAARLLRFVEPEPHPSGKQRILPPLGGAENRLNPAQRYFYVIHVAIFGVMVFAAITITIAGIVRLFSGN